MTGELVHETVELDANGADLVDQLAQARAAIKGWQEIERKCAGQLANLAGEGKYLNVLGQRRVIVIRNRPNRFNSSKFKNDHPDLYTAYVEPAEQEVVSVRLAAD